MPMTIKITRNESAANLPLPEYATTGSSGVDLAADIAEDVVLQPGARALIATGLKFALPTDATVHVEAQVRPRSGLALKHGISVLNTPGTIDADYRGEVKVILINLGHEAFTVTRGMRIAQLVFMPVLKVDFQLVESLEETARSDGGFGSTGVQAKVGELA